MKSAVSLHNYEEFFLLYTDNELSALERKAVEEFVRANPGLAVELELLQQVTLSDESLVFEDKQSLYRKESAEISLANYEEQFLLFVDNELSLDAKGKVETFVLQHPALQEEFTLLKQTKLEAETIVFPDKQSLYRKEEKERPVFYLRWQRMAVAAALIGLVVLIWNVLPGEKSSQQNTAQLENKNVPGTIIPNNGVANGTAPNPSVTKENNSGTEAVNNPNSIPTQTVNNTAAVVNQNSVAVPSNTNQTTTVTAGQTVNTGNTLLANNTEVPQTKIVEGAKGETVTTDNHNSFQTAIASTQKVSTDHSALENNALAAVNTDAVTGGPNNIDAQPAVYKELDTEDEKKSLLLGSIEINKDKLRGFFRKAGSIFRSKSKNEEEKTESRPSTTTRSLR